MTNEQTTETTETPRPVKKVPTTKTATKATKKATKTVTKKVVKGPAAKANAAPAEHGSERSHDLPWCDKKVTLFKTLKQLKALDAASAVSAKQVVEKSGEALTGRDVRHYSYHAKAGKLVALAELESGHGYGFYLTKAGAALDPVKEFKAQEAAKAE